LNKDSKGKISSTVVWKQGRAAFGQDAFNTVRHGSLSVFRAQRHLILILVYRAQDSPLMPLHI